MTYTLKADNQHLETNHFSDLRFSRKKNKTIDDMINGDIQEHPSSASSSSFASSLHHQRRQLSQRPR